MKKYASAFFAVHLLATVAFSAAADALQVDGGLGLNIAAALFASSLVAWWFVRDRGRVPTAVESQAFAGWALAGAWAGSLLLVAAAYAFLLSPAEAQEVERVAGGVLDAWPLSALAALTVVLLSATYYLAIRWSFAWSARGVCRPGAPGRR